MYNFTIKTVKLQLFGYSEKNKKRKQKGIKQKLVKFVRIKIRNGLITYCFFRRLQNIKI